VSAGRRPRAGAATVLSPALLVAAWWLVSLAVPADVVPGPLETLEAMWDDVQSGEVPRHVLATLNRVAWSFLLAMAIGAVAGVAMGLSARVERWLSLWVMVALTIPGLCYAIVAFLWVGLNEVAAVLAIGVATSPAVTITVWEGVKSIDNRLADMAKAFGAPAGKRLRRVVVPQLLPYLMAAARYGVGIIWKVAVLVELLGMSSGVGYKLHYWFQLNNMPQVFAWTVFFTIIMILIELVLLKRLEARLFAWRPAARV
jgi:NitT/TauT family transport system permease protein